MHTIYTSSRKKARTPGAYSQEDGQGLTTPRTAANILTSMSRWGTDERYDEL